MARKLQVLFLDSQTRPASDSRMHGLLMRYYDRRRVTVHVACESAMNGAMSKTLEFLEAIPDVRIVPTNFGPRVTGRSPKQVVTDTRQIIRASRSLMALGLYIKQHRIDVIHVSSRPRDALCGVILGKLTGASSVIHLHLKHSDWFSPVMRWALRNCDVILGVSDFVAQSARDAGYPSEKIHYVLNSLDASDWDSSVSGMPPRREFGVPPDAPLLAIASRLFYWKGHTELLEALALVRDREPSVRLLVVGEDDPLAHPGGGSYLAQLQTLAGDLGISDNVIFTGYRSDIRQILAACDIYAMPSFEEPCAVAFLEAMAMKRPVVALQSGGTPQLVEHGKSGLLSRPQDIEALAANILILIHDPMLRQRMGQYGRRRVEEYYNPRRMADEVEQIYWRMYHGTNRSRQS